MVGEEREKHRFSRTAIRQSKSRDKSRDFSSPAQVPAFNFKINKAKFLTLLYIYFSFTNTLIRGEKMIVVNYIAYILTIIGGLNWGLVGIFNFDLVNWMCMGRNAGSIIIYILIMLAAIWLIISPIISRGMLDLGCQYKKNYDEKNKTK